MLQPVPLRVQTVLLHVRATVLRPVHQKRPTVLLRVHRPVLLPVPLKLQAVLHHVLQLADLRVQLVLQLVDLREPTVLHHVPALVLRPAVPRVLAAATIVAVQTPAKSLS